MATVTIKINGLSSLQGKLNALVQQKVNQVDQAVQGAGINTQAYAKQAAPVDTGRFRAGYMYEKTGQCQCRVYNTVFYGPFLEFGHWSRHHKSFVAARPSLFPAYTRAKAELRQELAAIPGIRIVGWS